MTTPSTARKAGPFTGNGTQNSWPFTFKVFAASDIKVTIANAAGVETVLTLGTDYTVSVNANQETSPGGSVTYLLANGSKLAVTGDLDYDQPMDIPSGGNFNPVALENQLDRAAMQVQQLKEQVDRSAKMPTTASTEDIEAFTAGIVALADSVEEITTVAANVDALNTVASDLNEPVSEINTVATAIANVNAVGNNIGNVNTVAGISANVTTVAGIQANVTTVAGVAANVTTVAGISGNVTTVAGISADVQTVADNLADVTNFADVYYGPSASNPSTRRDGSALQDGDLYYNTGTKRLRVYNGATWVDSLVDAGTITVQPFSGNGSTTAFTLASAPTHENNTQVYIGGVYQQKDQYSVSGTTLTFSSAPPSGTGNIEVVTITTLAIGQTDAALVAYTPAGTGAVATTVQSKLRESVSVKDFGAVGDGVTDDTAAIQAAIDAASATGKKLLVQAGTYKLVPATSKTDEAGTNVAALVMRSGMHIDAEPGAVFRIANGVSSDAAPLRHSMFFSNEFLSDISLVGLSMDMNGQNNLISPSRGTLTYNRFTNAQVIFSGTPGGVASGANNVRIENCTFKNNAGVSCIVMAQSNSLGVTIGTNWKIKGCVFKDVGLDTDDHSSVFGWAKNVDVTGNTFENASPPSATTKTGGHVAYEIHGSDTYFAGNTIKNYGMALWFSMNLTESEITKCRAIGNTAHVALSFCDFYCANLSAGADPSPPIKDCVIEGNAIHILNCAVLEGVKAVFKIAARRQPQRIKIANNVCRSYETTKSVCMALLVVQPDQLQRVDQISITGNMGAGLQSGLVCYFGGTGGTAGTMNMTRVEFAYNRLGYLIPPPDGVLQNHDVYLYGASTGVVEELTVYGLEHPAKPILTDSAAGGRATVYGKAILDMAVTWSGVTIGNGSYAKKIALDTDSGHAIVDAGFVAGSSTTYSGNIAPTITGLVADSTATATAMYSKAGAFVPLASLIFNSGSAISLYMPSGAPFDSSQPDTSSYVFVNAAIPCRSASI
jgi:hypothetical protein